MKDNRVLLGFSGGIDSFAAVGLLQAAGYHVTALTLDMRGDSALLEKARLRAGALGIPWRMRSVRERFEREVVDYFTDSYFRGCTPAPCTRCNSRIKWPCLCRKAGPFDPTVARAATVGSNGPALRQRPTHWGFATSLRDTISALPPQAANDTSPVRPTTARTSPTTCGTCRRRSSIGC